MCASEPARGALASAAPRSGEGPGGPAVRGRARIGSSRRVLAGLVLAAAAALFAGAPPGAIGQTDAPGSEAAAEVEAAFEAMVNDPADLEKTFRFAALAARTGDLEGAVAALERMLLLEPDLPRVKLELGVLYYRLGSYVVARRYLGEAVAGDDVPAEVRSRVAEYVAAVDAKLARHRLSGFTLAGVRYQSNATAGPSSREVFVGGSHAELEDRFTGQSDADVFAAAGLEHRYDFRTVDGLKWVTGATLYGTRQRRESQVDLLFVEATTGPERGVGGAFAGGGEILVRPYLKVAHVVLDDRVWYRGAGAGVGLRYRAGDRLEVSSGTDAVRRRHQVHEGSPAAANRDGWVLRTHLGARHALTPSLGLRLSAGFTRHDLDARFERHSAVDLGAGLGVGFADPTGLGARRWTASFGVSRRYARYDAPDPTIDPERRRRQWEVAAEASLTVPLGERTAVVVSVGDRDVDASLPNHAHRNRWASAAVAVRF